MFGSHRLLSVYIQIGNREALIRLFNELVVREGGMGRGDARNISDNK